MTSPLQALAAQTAASLTDRVGVDGAIVIVVRKGDDSFGISLVGPEIPMDTMVATAVEALSLIRRSVRAAATPVERTETETETEEERGPAPASSPSPLPRGET